MLTFKKEKLYILSRRSKCNYQFTEQDRLKDLFCDQETQNFWKYTEKIGLQNDSRRQYQRVCLSLSHLVFWVRCGT